MSTDDRNPKSATNNRKKTSNKIPVVVCEFHQEVLEYIHRYIACKKLPFSRLLMVHFDAHPDLAYPDNLNADDCYSKEKMYNDLEIADWILPLMYMKHLNRMLWVKPDWSTQIPNLETKFFIGKEKKTGKLRVTCTEDYFIEDCSYSLKQNLENVSPVELKVITLPIHLSKKDTCSGKINCEDSSIVSEDNNEKNKTLKRSNFASCESSSDNSVHPKIRKLEDEDNCVHPPDCTEKYLLDIDLDFFSVTNPFKQDFTEEEYSLLKDIYRIDIPVNKQDQDALQRFVDTTRAHYERLKRNIVDYIDNEKEIEHAELSRLLSMIKTRKGDQGIDALMIHEAGITTDLPHHVSTLEEIEDLLRSMETFLKTMPVPTIITMARSTVDEYCPPDQIDIIQEKVLTLLRSLYDSLDIIYDYKDSTRLL